MQVRVERKKKKIKTIIVARRNKLSLLSLTLDVKNLFFFFDVQNFLDSEIQRIRAFAHLLFKDAWHSHLVFYKKIDQIEEIKHPY